MADKAGWEVVEEFVDRGISSSRGRDRRPAFDRLCKATTRHEFDVVMAWSVDRLSRSLQDLMAFLGELRAAGIDLYLDRQKVSSTAPGGTLFQMIGGVAEIAGGRRLGRPKVSRETETPILAARAEGKASTG